MGSYTLWFVSCCSPWEDGLPWISSSVLFAAPSLTSRTVAYRRCSATAYWINILNCFEETYKHLESFISLWIGLWNNWDKVSLCPLYFLGAWWTRVSFCITFKTNFTLSFLTLWFVSTCAVPHDTHNLTFRLFLANNMKQHHTSWGDMTSPRVAGMWEIQAENAHLISYTFPTPWDALSRALELVKGLLLTCWQRASWRQDWYSHIPPMADTALG